MSISIPDAQVPRTFSRIQQDVISEITGPLEYEEAALRGEVKSLGEVRAALGRNQNMPNNLAALRRYYQGILVSDMWDTDLYTAEEAVQLSTEYAVSDGIEVTDSVVISMPQVLTHVVILKVFA